MDVHDKQTRSYNMSRIKGRDTKPEDYVRKSLFAHGYRYRKNDKRLPGTPDIVLPKYKTVIFVNGCFWHKHEGCRYFVWPKNNEDFWREKINRNVQRDRNVIASLEKLGWRIVVIWECELKPKMREQTIDKLVQELEGMNERDE